MLSLCKDQHTIALGAAEAMLAANEGKRLQDTYVRATLVSYGVSCRVFSCYNRYSNERVAVKTIARRPDCTRQRARVLQEVATMKHVEDHPNAIRLHAVYVDDRNYHLVMDHCAGGELFEHIAREGAFTERYAADLLRGLMLFLTHCHAKGVAHLDIKPENIMFDSHGPDGVLKVIDFGAAEFLTPHERAPHAFGTVRYASPEMTRGKSCHKSDIWSVGVVMYLMLSGKAPFLKKNDTDTLALIKGRPTVRFSGGKWASVSEDAKQTIRALLTPSPASRPSAQEVLALPWIRRTAPDVSLSPTILEHLRQFAKLTRVRRLLMGFVMRSLRGPEANGLVRHFLSMDNDFTGTIEYEELAAAAKQVVPEVADMELQRMFKALDVDNTGTVDVTEFFASMLSQLSPTVQDSVAERSFRSLDRSSSGFITRDALRDMLLHTSPKAYDPHDTLLASELDQEFDMMDVNKDGVVTLEEFKLAMIRARSGGQLAALATADSVTMCDTDTRCDAAAPAGKPQQPE